MPHYTHLSHIDFESLEDRDFIWKSGMEKWKRGDVEPEVKRLGQEVIHKIESAYICKAAVCWINESVEFGLFAQEDIEEGLYVGEYTGIVRRNDRRYCEPLNNYCYAYPVLDEIGRNFVIDATSGNLTRFINHSKAPNLKPTYVFYKGFYHLVFFAMRKIKRGDQLFYNYGQNYWHIRDKPVDL